MKIATTILIVSILVSFTLGTGTGQKIDTVTRSAEVDSFFIKAESVEKKADTLQMRLNKLKSNQVATKVKINYLQSWIDRMIRSYNKMMHISTREPTPDTVIVTEIKVIPVQVAEEEPPPTDARRKPFRGIKDFFKKLFKHE